MSRRAKFRTPRLPFISTRATPPQAGRAFSSTAAKKHGPSYRAAALTAALALTSCADAGAAPDVDELSIVTTTGIIGDLVENVVGNKMQVDQIVPEAADPHSYEPTLHDVRTVAYADAAFSNYMLLEDQAIIRTLDANIRPDVPNIALAENAVQYSAEIIPLVENISLDTIWLGMRVIGDGQQYGADRTSQIELRATNVDGPGEMVTYLTESFGNPRFYIDSSDGFSDDDAARLPPEAHTHMSWAFTEPGVYEVTMEADLLVDEEVVSVADETTFTFAVGVNPYEISQGNNAEVLSHGHGDVSVDLDTQKMYLFYDPHGGGEHLQERYAAEEVIIDVPNRALHEIPPDPSFRFLGRAGEQIYQLPQAVLGAHVHGEIDPHLWHNVGNAQAYVEIIRDTVIDIDPENADYYRQNAQDYIRELEDVDQYVGHQIEQIPESNRHLITTHDAFGYLGAAYDIDIAGFVTHNPSTEPSIQDRRRLVETISNLEIPAVFLEPNLIARASVLEETAADLGVEVCRIYGDALDEEISTYVDMMRFNADSLLACLGAEPN